MTCAAALLTSATAAVFHESASLPDSISVAGTRDVRIESKPHIQLKTPGDTADAAISVDATYPVTAMLFGVLPIGSIDVTRVKPEYVELSGQPIGILLHTDGLVVAGLSPVATADGYINPGEQCGLKPGDIIRTIDGQRPDNPQKMQELIARSKGSPIKIGILRADGTTDTLSLTPVYSETDGAWRGGIWIKESSTGLGMLTFITMNKENFGGLGHAICDPDTGSLIRICGGDLMSARLTGVVPGAKGLPGELIGTLGDERLGSVALNCESGVYGSFLASGEGTNVARVAMKQELKEGRAQMLTTLPGDDRPELYDVMIEQINYDDTAPTRNLIIRVDDPRLLDRAGGIVQGMSGSPILQDGAFVAALTHVFVNDPTMGYGIFAENMIKYADMEQKSTPDVA